MTKSQRSLTCNKLVAVMPLPTRLRARASTLALFLLALIVQNTASLTIPRNHQYRYPQNQLKIRRSNCQLAATSSSSTVPQWTDTFGTSALGQVQNLASIVSAANRGEEVGNSGSQQQKQKELKKNQMSGDTDALFTNLTEQRGIKGQNRQVVLSALESLERDSTFLYLCICHIFFSIVYMMNTHFVTQLLPSFFLNPFKTSIN